MVAFFSGLVGFVAIMHVAFNVWGDCDPGRALPGAGASSGLEDGADGVC